jgi:hypothetical protein
MSPTQCPSNFNDASFCAWLALLDDSTSKSFLIAVTTQADALAQVSELSPGINLFAASTCRPSATTLAPSTACRNLTPPDSALPIGTIPTCSTRTSAGAPAVRRASCGRIPADDEIAAGSIRRPIRLALTIPEFFAEPCGAHMRLMRQCLDCQATLLGTLRMFQPTSCLTSMQSRRPTCQSMATVGLPAIR